MSSSLPLENKCSWGRFTLTPETEKEREEGEAEAWHIHTRGHRPELGSPTSVLHPPNNPSLLLPTFLAELVSSQAPQAFYFMVIDGEQSL